MLNQQAQLMDNQKKKFASEKMRAFLPMRRGIFARLKEIPKGKINARGWYYMFQTEAPRNFTQSAFAGSEGGIFKDAGGNRYLIQNVVAITHRARLTYTDQVEVANALAERQEVPHRVIDDMDKKHLQALENAMDRQFWGDRTNELARVSAINAGTRTITCDSASNLFGVYLLEPGDRLEVYSSGGVQRVGTINYLIVESVSLETKSFVYRATDYLGNALPAGPAGIVATDIIYPEGGKDNGITGVESIMSNSGAFQGNSDRTGNKQTTGLTINAGNQPLTVALLRKMLSEVRFSGITDNDKKSGWKFHVSTQQDAFDSLGDSLQATGQDGDTLSLGRTGRKFQNVEFHFAAHVKRDVVSLLNENELEKGVLQDYHPVGDAAIMKQVNGDLYDEFSIPYRGYWNMGCETARYAGVWLKGLTTSGYSLGNGA